jgi:polysaccharide deacetylase 2 family uncharacterized protein YibQ
MTRVGLVLVALLVFVIGFAVLWSRTEEGLISRARMGLPVDRAALARTLAKTLRTTLIDFGIPPGAQVIHTLDVPGPGGARVRWTAYLSGRASTLQLNARLASNLGKRGAEIVDAWEDTLAAPGSGVHLLVGAGRVVTHEIVLERRDDVAGAKGTEPARLLLVIDGFGSTETDSLARHVFDLDVPFTAAVLPRLPGTKPWIARLEKAGARVLVQLPMEPLNYPKRDPGPGAVLVDMSAGQILRTVRKDVGDVPHAIGATSYMGQMALGDEGAMRAVMQELRRSGLVYLDLRTVPTSVAADRAGDAGVLWFRADAVLEAVGGHDAQVKAIGHLFDSAVELARRRGYAIVLAHPDAPSLDVLRRAIPKLKRSGVRFESMSTLLEPRSD